MDEGKIKELIKEAAKETFKELLTPEQADSKGPRGRKVLLYDISDDQLKVMFMGLLTDSCNYDESKIREINGKLDQILGILKNP